MRKQIIHDLDENNTSLPCNRKGNPVIVGLYGNRGVGKDTVADILVRHHGFTKVAFADALRAEVSEAFGVNVTLLVDRDTKETPLEDLQIARCDDPAFRALFEDQSKPRSPREVLQKWGTEYRRASDTLYWHKKLLAEIPDQAPVVIPDMRFPDEYWLVRKSLRGYAVGVIREEVDAAEMAKRKAGDPTALHPSAGALDRFLMQSVIANNGDLVDLEGEVRSKVRLWLAWGNPFLSRQNHG